MKRMRIIGLAAVAVLALLAIGAGSAWAAPEWGACLKAEPKNTGNYADKACSVASEPGKGTYVLVGGSIGKAKKFKVKGLGSQTLHIVIPESKFWMSAGGDFQITCEKVKGSGMPVAPNALKELVLEFKKCTWGAGSTKPPCENVGKETIKTEPLAGVLAEVEGKVGEILKAQSGEYVATGVLCSGVGKIPLLGQVFGEYTGATNVISKTSIGHYTVGAYLGEPEPGYEPLVDPPSAGPPSYGVLYAEIKQSPAECDELPEACETFSLPSGLEGEVEVKGPPLMVKT